LFVTPSFLVAPKGGGRYSSQYQDDDILIDGDIHAVGVESVFVVLGVDNSQAAMKYSVRKRVAMMWVFLWSIFV